MAFEWLREMSAKCEAGLAGMGWKLGDCFTPDDFIDWLERTGASPYVGIFGPVQESPPLMLPTDEEYES